MSKFVISYFRAVSAIEGVSLLSLIFLSMPTRILFNISSLSKSLGAIHGILFLIFFYTLISIKPWVQISGKKLITFLLLSMIPFGFIFIDKQVKKLEPIS
ncbi:MAG: DUF3817 domain-containing protein [Spirochaetota bacterium]